MSCTSQEPIEGIGPGPAVREVQVDAYGAGGHPGRVLIRVLRKMALVVLAWKARPGLASGGRVLGWTRQRPGSAVRRWRYRLSVLDRRPGFPGMPSMLARTVSMLATVMENCTPTASRQALISLAERNAESASARKVAVTTASGAQGHDRLGD